MLGVYVRYIVARIAFLFVSVESSILLVMYILYCQREPNATYQASVPNAFCRMSNSEAEPTACGVFNTWRKTYAQARCHRYSCMINSEAWKISRSSSFMSVEKKDPKMASSFRTQKQHGRGDDAHWVVTLSGLISGP